MRAIGICFGIYVVVAICFHWMAQPTVTGLAAYEATAETTAPAPAVAPPSETHWVPRVHARVKSPASVASAPPAAAAGVAAPATDGTAADASARKPLPRKHVVRTASRPERSERPARTAREHRNPWDFAWRPSFGDRPWF